MSQAHKHYTILSYGINAKKTEIGKNDEKKSDLIHETIKNSSSQEKSPGW